MNSNIEEKSYIQEQVKSLPLKILLPKIFIALLCASAIGYLFYDANEKN